MPELSVTDDQLRRLEAVREELEAAYVGPYGTVRREDALEYLLDTYSPPEESAEAVEAAADAENPTDGAADGTTADGARESGSTAEAGTTTDGSGASGGGSPENTLQQAMNLLESHDDRWRESSGDEPYEVDLPDGSTEGVRTKDDVKRLLFKHWK
jgi:hypothetical protein